MRQWLFGFLLLLTVGGLSYLSYERIWLNPNEYVTGTNSDAIKNYYTFAYYLKYDKGTQFTGMNYPYGENIVFTDNQPAFAYLLNFIDDNITPIHHNAIAIVNYSMLISMFICAIFLYLIMLHFRFPPWYAFFAALIITFLSPQLYRISAHFSLAYTFFVPMTWYFLLKVRTAKRNWLWAIGGVIAIAFMGLVHLYYLLIGALFILAYAFVVCLANLRNFKAYKNIALLGFMGITPIVLVQIFLILTDNVGDRPGTPYGFFIYRSSVESLFVPVYGPFLDLWKYFGNIGTAQYEGFAYIGFVGVLALLFTIINRFRKAFKDSSKFFRITLSKELTYSFFAACLMVIFSSSLPFRWNLEFLLDYITPLKQFRSVGRFAWIFYYVATVYTAYYFYLVFRKTRQKGLNGLAVSLIVLVLFFWSAEAFINVKHTRKPIFHLNKHLQYKNTELTNILADNDLKAQDFQALMTVPYFSIGSEKISIHRNHPEVAAVMQQSWETGLPIAQSYLSRTSISQSLNLLQLCSSSFIKKDLLDTLPSDKPFLLMFVKNAAHTLPYEQNLLEQAELLGENEKFAAYKLPLAAFKQKTDTIRQFFKENIDSLTSYDNYYTTNPVTSTHISIQQFDKDSTNITFRGKGAIIREKGPFNLWENAIQFDTLRSMEASIWLYVNPKTTGLPILKLHKVDKTGNVFHKQEVNPRFGTETTRGWIKLTMDFDLDKRAKKYLLFVEGKDIVIDEFLIRPKNTDVFYGSVGSTTLIFNNYDL